MVFLKTYLGRRHFTGGWQGFYFAICHAFMRTTRIALLLEDQQGGWISRSAPGLTPNNAQHPQEMNWR
jgi:hypothetical protein